MTDEFATALTAFVNATQAKINQHFEENFPDLVKDGWTPKLSANIGSKNVKIFKEDRSSKAVFCFVRIEDGAILMAAGFHAPAKGVRGSIYVNNGQDGVTVYGARYLR